MTITYRRLEPGDITLIAELSQIAMPQDGIDERWLTENVLLDRNFHPDGLTIAARRGRPVGFIYAVASGYGTEHDPHGAWITTGCVHPEFRRQGIGTELLHRALAHLRRRGAHHVTYSGYPPAYFLPGLDARAYPQAAVMLEQVGFTRLYIASAMARDLSRYVTPPEVRALAERRGAEGYHVAAARAEDLPDVIAFAGSALAPDWGEAIRESVLRHQRPDRTWIVRAGKEVVAFATYGAYRGIPERFGPFGVDPSLRGTGLGKILLHRTMTAMRAEGLHTSWFLWTGEDSPAGHLYRSAGYDVTRRFDVLRLELASGAADE